MAENSQEQGQLLYARIVARTWADPRFKAELMANPNDVLAREYGLNIPQGVQIQVRENTPDRVHVALDRVPSSEAVRIQVEQLSASSCFGTAGSLGTAGSATGTFGTVACIGTAGSWSL